MFVNSYSLHFIEQIWLLNWHEKSVLFSNGVMLITDSFIITFAAKTQQLTLNEKKILTVYEMQM